jgi:hypothetical protein
VPGHKLAVVNDRFMEVEVGARLIRLVGPAEWLARVFRPGVHSLSE